MKKNIRNAAQAVVAAVLVSFAAVGCASSMATQDELAQLETINMEIQSLEQQKASLQKEVEALTAAIRSKESQLNDIKQKKSRVGQTN